MGWTDKLADMLRLNDGEQPYVGYPQMQVGLTKPRQAGYSTGFLEGATGMDSMQPKNPITDPNYDQYAQGKNTGELAGIAAMATPGYAAALKAGAPKAYNSLENYMVKSGGMIPLEAYHGTPHTIESKFDISKVGTGEGNQTFGHGMYFAQNPNVAGEYANKLAGPEGKVYKVNIPDEHITSMLDWDKTLKQQTPEVQQALAKANPKFYDPKSPNYDPNEKGNWIYMSIAGNVTPEAQKLASAKLNELGVKGVRYSDAGSRGKTQGTSNFVVFDPSSVNILEENGKQLTRKELLEQQVNKAIE